MTLTGAEANHLTRVLRLKPGSEIEVVGAAGEAAVAVIDEISGETATLRLTRRVERVSEPPIEVVLAQALTKNDKFDYIVQKAVELGASRIVPLAMEHCVVKYTMEKANQKVERWQKIAAAAVKQSGRCVVPTVMNVMTFSELLTQFSADYFMFFCYEQEKTQGIKTVLRQVKNDKILLIIGPEGGFSRQEATLALASGAHAVSFGPRILRTETAATAALAVAMYECGDLGGPSCPK